MIIPFDQAAEKQTKEKQSRSKEYSGGEYSEEKYVRRSGSIRDRETV
ncbi:hypothetical protein PbDSM24746_59870 [Paenibacillus macerans]|nr:hypothetical protein PbDSM24746_59870 [Paenibacillus macerans]GBK72312.1 hypothetical protein PbJCM17693_60200 [Paenibacillus macerans]GIP12461.1 hypothetical protein J1TS5_46310 [Paenibacillus macerans]